ncbi:hypothetical protein [Winogradskyella sp.]|uniref:hypothetical protein n=1 Tax=Winogradskyella sp. TaxID=1883156 RepID=UPI003F6CD128
MGIFQLFLMKDQWWLGLGWIVLSLMFIVAFLYQRKQKYITITDDYIKENKPFGKRMKTSEIIDIKYFSEDYIIKSETEEIRINSNYIDEVSLDIVKNKLLTLKN